MSNITVTMTDSELHAIDAYIVMAIEGREIPSHWDYIHTLPSALKALRNAVPAGEGWVPVEDKFNYKGGMRHNEGELDWEEPLLSISAESGYVWGTTELPDNIRLCRKGGV